MSKGYDYAGSNEIDEVAWNGSNSGGRTHLVGTKKPNELGIYDMSGNVSEWCRDWFDEDFYRKSPIENPKGPDIGTSRVLRGGSWLSYMFVSRLAHRSSLSPASRGNIFGFRSGEKDLMVSDLHPKKRNSLLVAFIRSK